MKTTPRVLRASCTLLLVATVLAGGALTAAALGEEYYLLTGVDATKYPGATRFIPGEPAFQPINDGDRLAGTADVGPTVAYVGTGSPMYAPNQLGSLSFLWRRGSIPFAGGVPILGIEFLGGPLLDLDGDLGNGARSLIPVIDEAPIEIPGTSSFIELSLDRLAGEVELLDIDITGNNEGAPNLGPGLATIVVTIAGTQPNGAKLAGPNPNIDTRVGSLTAYSGTGGGLVGVYRIENLGFELWEDSIDPDVGSPEVLGSMQFLGALRGWAIYRNPVTGDFPQLAGQGLGSTGWPSAAASAVGAVVNAAVAPPPTATIAIGAPGKNYTLAGNGGVAMTAFGGDLGAYLDQVVIPLLDPATDRLVYLESTGFGVNNSVDPVFTDTIGYDATFVAAASVCGLQRGGDSSCNGAVNFGDIDPFVAALAGEAAWQAVVPGASCDYVCVNDLNADGVVNFADIDPFVAALGGGD